MLQLICLLVLPLWQNGGHVASCPFNAMPSAGIVFYASCFTVRYVRRNSTFQHIPLHRPESNLSPTCGSTCSGQRWMGGGDAGAPHTGWAQGWVPVAIKVVKTSPSALQEVDSLQKLQSGFPGDPHVIQLLESHTHTDETSGITWTYIITRWASMTQHHAQHSGLPNDM